ncbi:hypothetical protein SEA_AMOCHICK_83 [Mycobacterium phage Amochick]|uniref:Uncharacterized protein n=1 Tax=Mycobacterium phage Amochick TaxID=2301540 RepID=A0A385D080_9CAUD|nr:hypothetical protein SEA_AMOCHICK_83 [Mycobacterium phage Amochick]
MTDHDAIRYCTESHIHTTTAIAEGDYDRCGECGGVLRGDDPRLATDDTGDTGVFDATTPPGITQLPAVTTSMTPAQFKEWLAADGTLFMVILPANRTFVIKVPAPQHEFFVAMMQQIRFALGPEVQAVRMNVVSGDPAAADGTATEAPDWAKPADNIARPSGEQEQPPTRHEYRDDIRHTVQHDIAGYAHVDIDGPQLHSVTCTCGHTATGDTRHDAYRSHNTHALHPEA